MKSPVVDSFLRSFAAQSVLLWLAVTLLGLAVLLLDRWLRRDVHGMKRLPLPPGPKPLPLIGNSNVIPREYGWRVYAEWKKTYGPIFKVVKGRDIFIILAFTRAVPAWSWQGDRVWWSEYHDDALRRPLQETPQGYAARSDVSVYEGGIALEAKVLARDLVMDTVNFRSHLERYTGSSILSVVYGRRIKDTSDPDVRDILACNESFFQAVKPGNFAVDSFPFLIWLPGWLAPFKELGKQWFDEELALFRRQLNRIREAEKEGKAPQCFALDIIRSQAEVGLKDDEAAYLAGSMYGAGADSTTSTIETCIMAFVLYPEAAARARAEIDALVGSDRMPTYADFAQMPYVQCFVKELLRWRPFVPGGMAHRLIQDDEYMGYRLPKGAIILGNVESIHMDEEVFPDPRPFKPERFMDVPAEKQFDFNQRSGKDTFPFGFGRRICPGMYLGLRSLGTAIPTILWGFDLEHAKDAQGNLVPVDDMAFRDSVGSRPLPFECSIKPRSEKHKEIMLREGWEARVE